jgi:hypothetical protein
LSLLSFSWRSGRNVLIVAAVTIALCEAASFLALGWLWAPAASPPVFSDRLVSDTRVMALRSNLNERWRTRRFDVTIRTNSRGYREDFEFELADVEVAFLGDSFTFGHGVEASERYPRVFADLLQGRIEPTHVVSFGRNNGFQPEHYEYFLKKNPELKARLIVVGLYLGNDLEPDVKETQFDRDRLTIDLPYRTARDGQLVSTAPYRSSLLQWLTGVSSTARLFAAALNQTVYRKYLFAEGAEPNAQNSEALEFGALNPYSKRAFDSLLNIAALARERGGRLVVLLIPQNFYAGPVPVPHLAPALWPRIAEIVASGGLRKAAAGRCRELGLECIDAGSVMTPDDFFPGDAHWNRAGHQKAGRLLFDYFSANGGLR